MPDPEGWYREGRQVRLNQMFPRSLNARPLSTYRSSLGNGGFITLQLPVSVAYRGRPRGGRHSNH